MAAILFLASQGRIQGGGLGGPDPPLSRLSLYLNTSFSLFRLDLCAFTAIRWTGGAATCCALKIILGYLRMRRHVRVAFISEPPSFNFLDPPLLAHLRARTGESQPCRRERVAAGHVSSVCRVSPHVSGGTELLLPAAGLRPS